ncbi:MAG: hypothetical protein AcusKO_14970 [Acuticoccus sp.]
MLNLIGTVYVEIFRNVPLILQVIFWYALLTHLPRPKQAYDFAGAIYLTNRGLMLPAFDMSPADVGLFLAALVLLIAAAVFLVSRAMGAVRAWGLSRGILLAVFAVLLFTGRTPEAPMISLPVLKGLRFVGGFAIKPEFFALLVAIAIFFAGPTSPRSCGRGCCRSTRGASRRRGRWGCRASWSTASCGLPLAIRAILPALSNQYIWLMKATTLGIAIGFPDYFTGGLHLHQPVRPDHRAAGAADGRLPAHQLPDGRGAQRHQRAHRAEGADMMTDEFASSPCMLHEFGGAAPIVTAAMAQDAAEIAAVLVASIRDLCVADQEPGGAPDAIAGGRPTRRLIRCARGSPR